MNQAVPAYVEITTNKNMLLVCNDSVSVPVDTGASTKIRLVHATEKVQPSKQHITTYTDRFGNDSHALFFNMGRVIWKIP
jgi:hypothetical protein